MNDAAILTVNEAELSWGGILNPEMLPVSNAQVCTLPEVLPLENDS
jgi:hypothetical protein